MQVKLRREEERAGDRGFSWLEFIFSRIPPTTLERGWHHGVVPS